MVVFSAARSAVVSTRRVSLVELADPEAEIRRVVRIGLAIEEHLFSGVFQPQLYPLHDHLTVI